MSEAQEQPAQPPLPGPGLDLEAIEVRLAKITPGKWEAYCRDSGGGDSDFLGWEIHGPPDAYRGQFERGADAQFIANAPTDIAALLQRVQQLEAETKTRFTDGAKETKERVLSAIDMAGLMEAKFGSKDAARVIAEIKLLVQSIAVE